MPISAIIITTLVCYFLGNHNGAICVSHMLGDDVRSHGSGNARGCCDLEQHRGSNGTEP